MVSYDSQNAVEKYLNTNHLHLEKSFHSSVVEDKEFTTIFLDDMYSVIDNKYKKIKKSSKKFLLDILFKTFVF